MVAPAWRRCSRPPASGSRQCLYAPLSAAFHHGYLFAGVFSPLWTLHAGRRRHFLEASWLLLLPDAVSRICRGLPADRALLSPRAFQRPVPLRVGWPGAACGDKPLSLPTRGGSLSGTA